MQHATNIGTSATLFVLGIELKKIEFLAGLVAISRHSQCLSLASCENFVKLLFGPRQTCASSQLQMLRRFRCKCDKTFFSSLIELGIIPSAASVLTSRRPDEITEKKEHDNN